MLSSKLNVLFHNSIPSCQMWKIHSWAGVIFSRQLFWVSTILCYLQNWTLGPKTLFSVARCEKFLHKQGLLLWDNHFEYKQPYVIFKNWMFCPITLFQVVRFEKIPSQAGVVVLQKLFWVSTILYYLQNWTFHVIFLFISIVFALSLHKPHFLLFKCNFDSLEWKFGTYSFM